MVSFLHGGWDNVHGVNPSHKLGGDSSGKEVDQNILISDSTEGSVVFEFRDIVKDVNFVVDLGGGQPSYGLFFGVFEDERVIESFKKISPSSEAWWVSGEGCFGFCEGPESCCSFFHKREGECDLFVIVVIDVFVDKEIELGIVDPGSGFPSKVDGCPNFSSWGLGGVVEVVVGATVEVLGCW